MIGVLLVFGSASGCESGRQQPASAAASEQDATGAKSSPTGEYWLFVRLSDFAGNYVLTVNGFPVEEEPVNIRATNQEIGARINTALIGEGNTASVQVDPYMARSGKRLQVGQAALEGWISEKQTNGSYQCLEGSKSRPAQITEAQVDSAYRAWTKRARSEWRRLLEWERAYLEARPDSALGEPAGFTSRRGGALDSLRAWAERHPMTVSTGPFDNERGPDFSEVFETAPRIAGTPADTARLKDYAMHLQKLMAAKDTAALFEEFTPFIESTPERRKVLNENPGALVMERERVHFDREDVQLRSWAGGRVWHLYTSESGNLFRTGSGFSKGGKIYVAEIDGNLRVVR